MYKDAVVEVTSEFILLGTGGTTAATGGTPLGTGTRADVILEGNGFFIKGHYIVCPAQLVLMPPSLTSVALRYPLVDADVTFGQIKNQMVRASRILVSVFNVNNKGHSFIYEADLVGVDGAGDIAVLRINYKKQWNLCNPCVEKCHPYFCFGESRCTTPGEKVYLIGDWAGNDHDGHTFNAVGAITDGLLSDNRYVDYSGWDLAELILVSAASYGFSAGLPILDCQGKVIGMQTNDIATFVDQPFVTPTQISGSGYVAGPSEYFMKRIIYALIKGNCRNRWNCHLESICDPAGAYYRYKKAYAGLAYEVFNGNYDVTFDYTSGSIFANRPRVRLDSAGNFLNSPSCKQLVGIKVVGVAGINPTDASAVANGFWYVPGGTGAAPLAQFVSPSPFLGKLLPGDIITHIGETALGDLECQFAPSMVTWRLCAGEVIEISYRRGGNALNSSDNGATDSYDNLFTLSSCLADFPYLMDYPWYAVRIFPLLSAAGFTFGTQQSDPQFPGLATGGLFHAAF
jgi:hypothetical protein